ncbi:hypothetical protein D5018_15805 [Parashewanella curva]|uniref:Uncharacterized protein n=1 Tax=Parashewanella curva TaxID=2338552 RepID=A0A3L8PVV9_9GAMM|nr:hypothetical protein [Parashewanella curva]RLV58723.1 hypothetical protein D5018_15805 [Parashewanella curva]
MWRKALFCGLAFFTVNSAMALPDLSEPNDIVPVYENVVEILNSNDNTILECNVVLAKLQDCKTKTVNGLNEPYRGASSKNLGQQQVVYVTEKGVSGLFSFQTDKHGLIPTNASIVRLPAFPYDDDTGGDIFEIRRSSIVNYDNPFLQRFFFSRTPADTSSNYGDFFSLELGADEARIINSQEYLNVSLPAFTLEQGNSAHNEVLAGVGQIGGAASETSARYPFTGILRGNNGGLRYSNSSGGTKDKVKATLDSDVASIAKVDGKYWVSYKSKKKFTRFDVFPNGQAVDPDNYEAPSNSNVEIKNIQTRNYQQDSINNFTLFADDNKIGSCEGESDFVCTDAFNYLDAFALHDGTNYEPTKTITSTSLGDHDTVIFQNLNYSPINASEVTRNITIPDSLTAAFSGSCLTQVDFDKENGPGDEGIDSCTLNYDARKLTNTPPIDESFDVSFTVHGPFGDVPTSFHFNINLPTSIPHFVFEKDGVVLPQLNLNAGDTGSFEVTYISNQNDSKSPNISFLNGTNNSSLLRSYFTDTGCLAVDAPPLNAGGSCTLSYHIPAKVNSVNYTLNLNNSEGVPADDGTLTLELASRGNVIAHYPHGSQNIEHLSSIHQLDILPGGTADIRFTNVGAATAHNFQVKFIEPTNQHVPYHLDGSCVQDPAPDLSALGGSCDLTIKINNNASLSSARYPLRISGDDIDGYDIPITINSFPHGKGIGVVDSNTEVQGDVELSQTSSGFLTVTNYTGYDLSDLKIILPFTSGTVFYGKADTKNSKSCLRQGATTSVLDVSLASLENCKLFYHVNSDYVAKKQNENLTFTYTDTNTSTKKNEKTAIHFTNQPAIRLSELNSDLPLTTIELDASVPKTVLVFTNEQNYKVQNLNVGISDPNAAGIMSNNTCQGKALGSGESCSVILTLDDFKPLIGKYNLTINSDNLLPAIAPININQAQTDTVTVTNYGGYVLSADFTDFHANQDGKDSECKSGSCYAKDSTGWFTNPNNRQVTGVSGRNITLNMMAGTSRTLPSCDQGKIECYGTTFGPDCHYARDDTDKGAAQNQCLKYNPTK